MKYLKLVKIFTLIFSLSLFELGQSMRLAGAYASDIKELAEGENVTCDDSAGGMNCDDITIDMKKTAAERNVATILLWLAAGWSVLMFASCIIPGQACGLSALGASISALALIAGEVVTWVYFRKGTVEKISVDRTMLKRYSEYCEAIANGEENPAPVSDRNFETNKDLYCDQFGAIKAQIDSFELMKKGLEIKIGLLWTYVAGMGIAVATEIVGAIIRKAKQVKITMTSLYQQGACTVQQPCNVAACTPQGAVACAGGGGVCNCNVPVGTCIPATTAFLSFAEEMIAKDAEIQTTGTSSQPCVVNEAKWEAAWAALESGCNIAATTGCACAASNFATLMASKNQQKMDFLCKNTPAPCEEGCIIEGIDPNASNKGNQEEIFKDEFFTFIEKIVMNSANAQDQLETSSFSNQGVGWYIGRMLSYVGGVAAALAIWKAMSELKERFYFTPMQRGLISLGVGALVGGVSLPLAYSAKKEVEENIEMLNKVLEKAEISAGASTSASFATHESVGMNFESMADLDFSQVVEQKKMPCAAGGDGKGGCKKVGGKLKSTLLKLNLGSLTGVASEMETMGEELSGSTKISSKAFKSAGKIANAARSIRKYNKKLLDQYNKSSPIKGQKPYDLEKIEDKFAKKIMSTVSKALKDPSLANKIKLDKSIMAKTSDGEKLGDEFIEELEKRKQEINQVGGEESENMFGNFQLDLKKRDKEYNFEDEEKQKAESKGFKYDDVNKKSYGDLFKFISSRYLKSAFPILLEQEE